MGKPTGFIEYLRELPTDRTPTERVKDWKEFHHHMEEKKLRTQGARCMDCGIPFCHTRRLIAGRASGCPINNLIPEWNDLVYRGLWKEALERLHKTNNFPEFTGRVCPAPCEGSCVLGLNELPVTIKNIEAAIIDNGFAQGWVQPEAPVKRTGKKVAVIGSGPSGLACAAQLKRAGHSVTVYERADRIGGLLMYGIPNMKLDKAIVQRRIDLMASEGVEFVTSAHVGVALPAAELKQKFDALVLCTGATKGDGNFIAGKDRHVIGIGGGDTGTDCVGTAMRHGCRSLVQLEILPRPADTRQADNPWPEWPKVYKLDYGQEEAAARFGADPRAYVMSPQKFTDDGKGNVKEVHCVNVEWTKNNGAFVPKNLAGTDRKSVV